MIKTIANNGAADKQGLLAALAKMQENAVEPYLQTAGQAPVDLLIRTGGEQRVSNFLLWQAAYAELYFSDTLWPNFTREHLYAAVQDYSSRQRRFGLTGEQLQA